MSQKKNFRADNTYLATQNPTDNPKLGARVMQDGRESLFLDYYYGYHMEYSKAADKMVAKKDREREYLHLYLWVAPRTPQEREMNRETLELAKKIQYERSQELLENARGYRLKRRQGKIDFIEYYQAYLDKYTKKDKRMVALALQRFRDFLRDTTEYSHLTTVEPKQIDKDMITAFVEYLQSRSKGEGANSIYARFKKVVKYSVEHDIMPKNPCDGISIKVDEQQLKKDILSPDEVTKLVATHYEGENPNIRRAFVFCLFAGLRFCDVKDLTYESVDYANRLLKFEQNKTKGHSNQSGVIIPLNDTLLAILGEPESSRRESVFNLPSYETCLHAIGRWVKRAGIDKHISWHCARHSFAVNILNNGANIKTVASLLGHSGLRHTEKYTRAIDSLKKDAIDSLGNIKL